MFYWFIKGDQTVRYEAREISPTHFELTVIGPGATERVERFSTADALHAREVELQAELETDGWTGPHGWHV
jgi:hypothetical protein